MIRNAPWPRRGLAVVLVVGGLLALPSAGHAAEIFGSQLGNEPANGPEECNDPPVPCTFVGYTHSVPPEGDLVPNPAPFKGVVVKLRIRSFTPDTVTFAFADISVPNQGLPALATLGAVGPTVTFAGTGAIEEFDARVPVGQGMHVALNATSHGATYNSSGGKRSYEYAPPLVAGQGARGSTGDTGGEMLVQAQIERDADGDGFGDETQDQCPAQATTQGPCDAVGPAITGLKVAGGKVRYRLSKDATVAFRLSEGRQGRRVGRKCKPKTKKNSTRPRCTRYVKVGRFTQSGAAGPNVRGLPKRLGGRKVGPGRYRLVVVARDAAGNATKAATVFRIKPRK